MCGVSGTVGGDVCSIYGKEKVMDACGPLVAVVHV